MKLSSRTQYAIKAMLELANSPKHSISLNSLSTTQNISLSYLEQIFAALRKNQLVKSVRGPGGGYLIAKPMEAITIADIVIAIDPMLSRCAEFQSESNVSKSMWNSLSHKIYGFGTTVGRTRHAAAINGRKAGQFSYCGIILLCPVDR